MRNGIWMASGKHPPTGLTPSCFINSPISVYISCRRGSRMPYFLYFSLIEFICGWIFCILSADFMLEMRNGISARLMIKVWMQIAQPQFLTMPSIQRSHKKSGRAITPQKPKLMSPRKSGSAPTMVGTGTDSKVASALGPTYIRATVGPLGLPTAAPSTSTGAVSCGFGFFGFFGTLSGFRSVTKAEFCESFGVVVVLLINLTGRIGRESGLVSEARRPCGVSRDLTSPGNHRGFDTHHVGMVEAEALADGHIAVGVFKRNCGGRFHLDRAKMAAVHSLIGLRNVKGGIQLVALGLVVSPQGERVAILFRSGVVDQIQRLFFVVRKFLQDPGLDLRATVGERDAVQIVLNHSFRFRSCLLGRAGIERRNYRLCWLGMIDGSSLRRCLRLALGLLCRTRRLWKIFLEYRLEQHDDQEGQGEDEKQPALHAWFLLRILEFCQIYFLNDCKAWFRQALRTGTPQPVDLLASSLITGSIPPFANGWHRITRQI